MFYISMVRNLTGLKVKNPKAVGNLRQHLMKSKIEHDFAITYEISPANQTHHLHALIVVRDQNDLIAMMDYIDKHHLKAYVDKCKQILQAKSAQFYYRYIHKDLTMNSKLYEDCQRSNYKMLDWRDWSYLIDVEELYVKPLKSEAPPLKCISKKDPDDIFIDSDSDTLLALAI